MGSIAKPARWLGERDVHDPSFIVGPSRLAGMFGRSRWWAHRLLREWLTAQEAGGPTRVFRRASGYLYTTVTIVEHSMPRRRDESLERRLAAIEADLLRAFSRISDLERRAPHRDMKERKR